MNHDKASKLIEKLTSSPVGRELLAKKLGIQHAEKGADGKLNRPIVAVLTPSLDAPKPDHTLAMAALYRETLQHSNIYVYTGPGIRGSSVVHWSRNYLIAELLKANTPWTNVLFIDDDIVPEQNSLIKLVSQQKEICAGICTKRQDPPVPNIRWFDDSTLRWGHIWKWPLNACIEVGGVGTGMMLISRHALEQVAQVYFDCLYEQEIWGLAGEKLEAQKKARLDYFDKEKNAFWFRNLTPLNGGHEYGEDMSFCFIARRYCGIPIHCDTSVQPNHVGNYGYGVKDYLDQQEIAISRAIADGSYIPNPEIKAEASYESQISLLMPTRKRPWNVIRLLDSLRQTSIRMPEVVLYIDDDDLETIEMAKNQNLKSVIGPRRTLSECWNECFKVATGDVLMHCGDDLIFRTTGWDEIVGKFFDKHPDKLVFAHGDDGHFGDKFGTHGFIHRKWVETVGYFVPPYFSSDYNDTWLNDVANALERRVYLPILTEHMHFLFGKGALDQTHKERLERHKTDKVDELYESLRLLREDDTQKLRAAIGELVTA